MWWRWHRAPWWVLSIIYSFLFAVPFAVATTIGGGDALSTAVPGALGAGIAFGAIMGPATARTRRRVFDGIPAGADTEQQRLGARASRRGPVPTDPVAREVAVHLVRCRLEIASRSRRGQLLSAAIFTALYLILSVTWSPWWLAAVAFFVALLVHAWREPRLCRRRLALLTSPDEVLDQTRRTSGN